MDYKTFTFYPIMALLQALLGHLCIRHGAIGIDSERGRSKVVD